MGVRASIACWPINSGDRFIELRAILKHRPSFPVAIAYESAAWMLNLARRSPGRDVIAIPKDQAIPKILKSFRITRRWGKLDPVQITDLPTWRMETLIVLMAERPTAFKAWPSAMEWLRDAALLDVTQDYALRIISDARLFGLGLSSSRLRLPSWHLKKT